MLPSTARPSPLNYYGLTKYQGETAVAKACRDYAIVRVVVVDYFGLDRSLIHPVTTEEMKEPTPRPRYSGLSVEKAKRELGYRPHTLEEGLGEMRMS